MSNTDGFWPIGGVGVWFISILLDDTDPRQKFPYFFQVLFGHPAMRDLKYLKKRHTFQEPNSFHSDVNAALQHQLS